MIFCLTARAHPRECGADLSFGADDGQVEGSSPRVRGRHGATPVSAGDLGLIPASAGQTWRVAKGGRRGGAHPRECGADQQERQDCCGARGLIPASAGQTGCESLAGGDEWAHPRECGADLIDYGLVWHPPGSSPRERGRLRVSHPSPNVSGLIPASAGQTLWVWLVLSPSRAHPRECGADHHGALHRMAGPGSSPRVRGRRHTRGKFAQAPRLIPASAGQTPIGRAPMKVQRAHPRECGADTF